MAPSFAELKARAAKAKDAGVSKIQSTKDRHTSVPLAKTNWDPYSKQPPPPPPPPRVSANTRPTTSFPPPPPAPGRPALPPPPTRGPFLPSRSPATTPMPPPPLTATTPRLPARTPSAGPPPIIRSTRPDFSSRPLSTQPDQEIDWANLTTEDKEVFFSWLDEFFSKFFDITISPRSSVNAHT
ncbi:hypothetical protein Hypma_005224 [Hypsizygus marmoreus]|uniref:Uncharacterized protein n=1 Tax=Hypsizygus marmoreus TaxID=39966 RepID=A0A369J3Y2_HYPMA|nr:hypothetical protein Hypma_005224 [Hypsizygus marmoreus]